MIKPSDTPRYADWHKYGQMRIYEIVKKRPKPVNPVAVAIARAYAEHAEGWGFDSCPYPEDGPERSAWLKAWDEAEIRQTSASIR